MAGSVRAWVVDQFGRPTGFWGAVAGRIMASRPSNRRRNAWTIALLDLKPGERVLEIGFGPGLALAHAAARVGEAGRVAGVDRSLAMLAQATRRNQVPILRGWMDLRLASVEALPDLGTAFDAIVAINTIGFWPDPVARLQDLGARLAPGGRLAVTVQPRSKGATAETSRRMRAELEARFIAAGFGDVTGHTLALVPPAVCLIGRT